MRRSLWIILAVLIVAIGAPNAHADSFTARFTCTQLGGCLSLPTTTTATFVPSGPNVLGAFTWNGSQFNFLLPGSWLPTDNYQWTGSIQTIIPPLSVIYIINLTQASYTSVKSICVGNCSGIGYDVGNLILSPQGVLSAQCTPGVILNYRSGDTVFIRAQMIGTHVAEAQETNEVLTVQSSEGPAISVTASGFELSRSFVARSDGTVSVLTQNFDVDEICNVGAEILTPILFQAKNFQTSQQATTDMNTAQSLSYLGTIEFVLGGLCGPLSVVGCPPPLAAALMSAGAGTVGTAWLIDSLTKDPPDPNFTVIAQPLIPPLAPLTAQLGITQAEADAYNAMIANQAAVSAFLHAIITSKNRAQGAAVAGNSLWVARQLQAANQYLAEVSTLLSFQPLLLANFQNALVAAGFSSINVSLTEVLITEVNFFNSGLPPAAVQFLTQLGFTSSEISQIGVTVSMQDPQPTTGAFPGKLTDSQFLNALQQEVQVQITPFANLSARLEIEAGQFEVNANFVLASGSPGIHPISEPVSIQIGNVFLTVPAGAFKETHNGKFAFEGSIENVEIEVAIKPIDGGGFALKAEGAGANLTQTGNPIPVGITIGKNGGALLVTAEFE